MDYSRLLVLRIGDEAGLRLSPEARAASGLAPGVLIFIAPGARPHAGDLALWHERDDADRLFVAAYPAGHELPGVLLGKLFGRLTTL